MPLLPVVVVISPTFFARASIDAADGTTDGAGLAGTAVCGLSFAMAAATASLACRAASSMAACVGIGLEAGCAEAPFVVDKGPSFVTGTGGVKDF